MTERLTNDDVLRMRMRAQGLAGSVPAAHDSGAAEIADTAGIADAAGLTGGERVASIARRMLAMQGQDWRSSRWAVGLRAPAMTSADVTMPDLVEALNTGSVVRSWPMRGTVHLVAAADIDWLQQATNRKPLAGAAKRRAYLGMSDAVLERLVEVSVDALGRATPRAHVERAENALAAGLTRDELAAIWTEAGIDWKPNWRYHIVWWLCQNGFATLGPTDGRVEPRIVLAAHWITHRRTPEDPLRELAARYASARGPVTAKDLAWWAGLGVTEARGGLEAAAESGSLVETALEGAPGVSGRMWVSPGVLGASGAPSPESAVMPEWRLLPAFDEHLLGYAERAPQLDPAQFERVLPGRNGVFLATVVHRGRVAGTWKADGKDGATTGIAVTPFPGVDLDDAGLEALAREAARRAAFAGDHAGPAVRIAE